MSSARARGGGGGCQTFFFFSPVQQTTSGIGHRVRFPIWTRLFNIKTGSKGIEATLRRRRILSAGFVTRMEDTRLPKCVMFGELVGGAGCVGGQEQEWMDCFLDDLIAFGIKADQWTTAAQDEREWRRTAEQGAEHFMAKWIAAEKAKAGLRSAVVCPNVTGKAKKKMIAQSKRARRAGSLALVD